MEGYDRDCAILSHHIYRVYSMILELALIGVLVGSIAGFFGVGGGMLLVPILMTIGFDIKSAISVSVVQMVFSSVYGSYLNYRRGKLHLNEGIWVGVGGLLGGVLGARLTDTLPKQVLEYVFLALILFAIVRIMTSKTAHIDQEEGSFSAVTLFVIGLVIGVIAMMLGVGGSVMLTPILVGFLHIPTKKAATAGLFFVVFSSISGLVYKLFAGSFSAHALALSTVLSVAIAALAGVMLGLWLKDRVKDTHHKLSMIALYFVILAMLLKKIFF